MVRLADDVDSVESIEMANISEEESDEDDDDEVFVRGTKSYENGSAKKPLIKGSCKKNGKRKNGLHAEIRTGKPKYRRCCGPLCLVFLAFKALIGVSAIIIVLVNYFTHSGFMFWSFGADDKQSSGLFSGCHDLTVIDVWQAKFPQLLAEGSTRLINVSGDDVLDVVMGFGTGADGYNIPDYVCDIYFGGQKPCLGGVMALDGKTGEQLWRLWTPHEIFALTCQADLDGDSVPDCLAGGRAGVFLALSAKTGKQLWSFGDHAVKSDLLSVYAAQFVVDVDGDNVQDVLAVHGGDGMADPGHEEHMYGRLLLFSGKTGKLLRWMPSPDRKESYYPPQVTTNPDGRQTVIFGTGGNVHAGSLYTIALLDLYRGNSSMIKLIYRDDNKGIMTPAALVDLNHDGVQDIILASFSNHVMAFDGLSYVCLWNRTFHHSESFSSVAVALYDEDDIPDVLVKYQFGDGFPVYQYEQTAVLSGRNGSVLSPTLVDSLGSQSSPLALSLEGRGNDIFLHWVSNCEGHEGEKLKYGFMSGTHVHEKSRSDVCRALFGRRQVSVYTALSRHLPPNITLYNSSSRADFEHSDAVNTSALANKYLASHPDLRDSVLSYAAKEDEDPYAVLPYKKKDFQDALELLQQEMEREYAGQPAPYIDPDSVAYVEGEDEPLVVDNTDYDNDSAQGEQQAEQRAEPRGSFGGGQAANARPYQYQQAQQSIGGMRQAAYPGYMPQGQQQGYPQGGQQQGYPQGGQQQGYPQGGQGYPGQVPYPQQGYGGYGGFGGRKKREAKQNWQGIHRQAATGTLAPPMILSNDTMDLILPTYWIYPPKVDILTQDDLNCIKQQLKSRMTQSKDDLADKDYDLLYEDIETKCMNAATRSRESDSDVIYETPSDYDPLSINMGQLVVYRLSLRCECDRDKLAQGEQCAAFKPFSRQGWPSYMGRWGDSLFRNKS